MEGIKSFNIFVVNTGHYHVFIRIASLLASEAEASALACWFLSRSPDEKINIIWEEGMTLSMETMKSALGNFSTVFEAIANSPAYDNTFSAIEHVFSGLAAYMVLVTGKVHWGKLGCLYFDGWKRGRKIDEVGVELRSRYRWVDSLLNRGKSYGWLTEEDIAKITDGIAVWKMNSKA